MCSSEGRGCCRGRYVSVEVLEEEGGQRVKGKYVIAEERGKKREWREERESEGKKWRKFKHNNQE